MSKLPEQPTEEISNLLAGYALDCLEPEEHNFVLRNLPRRPAWQRELGEFQHVAFALGHEGAEQDVPLRVRAGVLAQVADIESDVPLKRGAAWNSTLPSSRIMGEQDTSRWRGMLPRLVLATAMPATIVAIVFAMYTVVIQHQISDQQAELAEYAQKQGESVEVLASDLQDHQVVELVESNEAPFASGRLFIDNEKNSAMLVARDLPALQDGEGYIVWVATDDFANEFARIGVIEMKENGTGSVLIDPPDSFKSYRFVTVTREASLDVIQPTGPEVLSGGM